MARAPDGQGNYEPVQQQVASDDTVHEVVNDPVKPKTYYDDGPFDAPSSEDEDDLEVYGEKHIEQPSSGEGEGLLPRHQLDLLAKPKGNRAKRFLLYSLGVLVLLAASIAFFSAQSALKSRSGNSGKTGKTGEPISTTGTRKITMDHVFNNTFGVERRFLRWVPEAGDGIFSIEEDGFIKLVDLKSNTTKNLVKKSYVRDGLHRFLSWDEWSVSADLDHILVKSDVHKQWRYSSHANYFVHKISINYTRAVAPAKEPPIISTAIMSPASPPTVLFVEKNDLYMLKLPALRDPPIRITHDGSDTVFNGAPDWVYEEEVFGGDKASWWCPDGQKIAFLRFDETNVNEYKFPIYNEGFFPSSFEAYTPLTTMKYPKPGYPNPLVTLHVFDIDDEFTTPVELTWDGRLPINDSIITEVVWVSPMELLIKETDRAATTGQVVLFDISKIESGQLHGGSGARGKIVRKLGRDGEEGDEGWIDQNQYVRPLKNGGYLDIVPTPEGYDHLAFFPTADAIQPFWLTRGEWEVTGPIDGVNEEKGIVYFTAANPSSIERHVYSVPLPDSRTAAAGGGSGLTISPLTDITARGWHSASFSKQSGFYVLRYDGPSVPTQRVLSIDNSSFEYVLTDNEELKSTVSEFIRPSLEYGTVVSDGYELNTVEMRPPNFDSSGKTKYPVLFRVYGGPHSQLVDAKFSTGWHDYLSSSLNYIIVQVDGRGTMGSQGRKLRNPVKGRLGKYEVVDQINAAKDWASRPYVDKNRIGVWGWSYGGYMASKIAEANAGVHKLAISVAPVVDWRMYDSIYTERYMGTPASNPDGYNASAVHDVTGFNAIDFALAHGSGDDNVHFANTAHLLDLFTVNRVRNFRFRMFTDSDHSISTRGAYRELHEWLTKFLLEKWGPGMQT